MVSECLCFSTHRRVETLRRGFLQWPSSSSWTLMSDTDRFLFEWPFKRGEGPSTSIPVMTERRQYGTMFSVRPENIPTLSSIGAYRRGVRPGTPRVSVSRGTRPHDVGLSVQDVPSSRTSPSPLRDLLPTQCGPLSAPESVFRFRGQNPFPKFWHHRRVLHTTYRHRVNKNV